MRTPALVFDCGNVVAYFDYRKAAERVGRPLGLSGEVLLDRVRAAGLTPLLQRFERGRMTAEAFGEEFCALAGLKLTHQEFVAAWSDIFWLNDSVAALIADLKGQGYTLVLGSNTNDLHAAQFRRQFADSLAHFDRMVLSHELGHVKPSAAFYIACAEAAGASPGECVFIDDLPENVEGARLAGLIGLHYRDTPALRAELGQLGVEVGGL